LHSLRHLFIREMQNKLSKFIYILILFFFYSFSPVFKSIVINGEHQFKESKHFSILASLSLAMHFTVSADSLNNFENQQEEIFFSESSFTNHLISIFWWTNQANSFLHFVWLCRLFPPLFLYRIWVGKCQVQNWKIPLSSEFWTYWF